MSNSWSWEAFVLEWKQEATARAIAEKARRKMYWASHIRGNPVGYTEKEPELLRWAWDESRENDCPEDTRPSMEATEDLSGLTIIEHPHITAAGSIVAEPMYRLEGWHRPIP